jgi:DNA (cytosine-5)-methyltransferase 1
MRELSLFSGAGGGLLGTLLLGWRPVGYVEWDDYCQRVIAQRIKDGFLPEAPIFSDVRAFVSDGYARAYQGMVDVVTAGFPCQPFSTAGKQLGELDERNMWPDTLRVIREVRPRFVLLENVASLVSNSYFGRIQGDLAESGYDARWDCISAADVGAPHRRRRVWIVAHARGEGWKGESASGVLRCTESRGRNVVGAGDSDVSDADGDRCREWTNQQIAGEECGGEANAGADGQDADTNGWRFEKYAQLDGKTKPYTTNGDSQWQYSDRCGGSNRIIWWDAEPKLGRVADGVAHRVDRLAAIGNGQVPAVVRAAWCLLNDSGFYFA